MQSGIGNELVAMLEDLEKFEAPDLKDTHKQKFWFYFSSSRCKLSNYIEIQVQLKIFGSFGRAPTSPG